MSNTKLLTATAAALCLALPALANDPVPPGDDPFAVFSEVEGWTVFSDAARGSCLIEAVDEAGNVVQMGLTPDAQYGYVGVFTLADVDIRNKQMVEIDIDGAIFTGEARGIKASHLAGDYQGGYILANNPNFGDAIANGRTMLVFPEKTAAFAVNLDGTKAAIAEARKCTTELFGS
jgi:hypothetical protein